MEFFWGIFFVINLILYVMFLGGAHINFGFKMLTKCTFREFENHHCFLFTREGIFHPSLLLKLLSSKNNTDIT